MAEVLGDQAALVKQNGFGVSARSGSFCLPVSTLIVFLGQHTSIYQSSACVTDIITAYLKDGTVRGVSVYGFCD